jgi:hypothetical protein
LISADGYLKSSFSSTAGCVEVRLFPDDTIGLRDSKDISRPAHVFTALEWHAFVAGVRAGEFDLPERLT